MTTVKPIIVGKMPQSQLNGQLSLLNVPYHFAWLNELTASEISEFLVELFEAVSRSQSTDEWSLVTDVIEAWQATAEIKADNDVVASIEQGLSELKADDTVSWSTLQANLREG